MIPSLDDTVIKVECDVDCHSFVDIKEEEVSSSFSFIDVDGGHVKEKDDFNSSPFIDINVKKEEESSSFPFIDVNVKEENDLNSNPLIDIDGKKEEDRSWRFQFVSFNCILIYEGRILSIFIFQVYLFHTFLFSN